MTDSAWFWWVVLLAGVVVVVGGALLATRFLGGWQIDKHRGPDKAVGSAPDPGAGDISRFDQ